MKSDTDQLIHLINNVETYSLKELGLNVHSPNIDNVEVFLKGIVTTKFDLPKGTVFKIRGLDKLFKVMTFLFIAGDVKTGNIVITVDRNCLDVEEVLYAKVPDFIGFVKCVKFPNVNSRSSRKAIEIIIRSYKDLVNNVKLGIRPKFKDLTLLNMIFEFVLTGTIEEETVD